MRIVSPPSPRSLTLRSVIASTTPLIPHGSIVIASPTSNQRSATTIVPAITSRSTLWAAKPMIAINSDTPRTVEPAPVKAKAKMPRMPATIAA